MAGDSQWRFAISGQKHPDDLVCAACGQPLGHIDSDPDHLMHYRPDRNRCSTRIPWFDATTRKNWTPA